MCFIWDFTVSPMQLYGWNDGLKRALEIMAEKYGVYVNVIASDKPNEIYERVKEFKPDYILGWGSLDRPSFAGLSQFKVPTGLCFAGGGTKHPHTENFDVVFVENKSYLEQFKEQEVNVIQAFGTNESLFQPIKLNKRFIACYPASFARWKRHNLFADATESKGIAVGKFLENEPECFDICVQSGNTVLTEVPYKCLPEVYNQSVYTLVTAANNGGGQRNVLESMACNVPPIVMSDSDKNCEFVEESGYGIIVDPDVDKIKEVLLSEYKNSEQGRNYILKNYSAEKYADKIYNGLIK